MGHFSNVGMPTLKNLTAGSSVAGAFQPQIKSRGYKFLWERAVDFYPAQFTPLILASSTG